MSRWRALTPIEWVAIAAIIGGIGFAVSGPPIASGPRGPEVGSLLEIVRGADNQAKARLDDAAFLEACRTAGLPDPPALDGGDPIPVRNILVQYGRWSHTGDPEAVAKLGQIYLALDEHLAALDCFAAAAALDPDHPDWEYLVGVEAQALGLDDLAIRTFEAAAKKDAGYATTFARLGRLYLERDDLDSAEQRFDRCRAANPSQSLGYVGLGRVALARKDYGKAANVLLQAVQVTGNDYRAYRFLSQALAGIGRDADARQATTIAERLPKYSGWLVFDERLQAAHEFANTQRHLENQMRLAQSGGNDERLAALCAELLRRRPSDYKAWGVRAGALIRLKRLDEARESIERALAIAPDSVSMLCIQAQIDMLARELATALEVLDRAMAIDPEFASVHDIRGRVLYLSKRYDEAFAAMRKAIALDPRSTRMRLALAVMYEQQGATEDAKRELRALLEIDPTHTAAKNRLARLEP